MKEASERAAGPCCGGAVPPDPGGPRDAEPVDRPGYEQYPFVEAFLTTPAGAVPRVRTVLDRGDVLGALRVRLGVGRDRYRLTPGLYAAGKPGPASPVLVTANYKLTFDALRRHLAEVPAWILVLDTQGVNVWCAAGKGTFSTEEVIRRVVQTGLADVVSHRELILPQLGATGVVGREVGKACGFRVRWGPVRAEDLPAYLRAGRVAAGDMRWVSFSFRDRLVLVPVELSIMVRYVPWVLLGLFLVSGIGSGIFSVHAAWSRGGMLMAACLAAILAGAVATPLLLPWLPGRAFSLKGAVVGLLAGLGVVLAFRGSATAGEMLALFLFTLGMSSYMAMNFTGATPYTSPSGVEAEMRRAIPLQAGAVLIALAVWVGTGFGA